MKNKSWNLVLVFVGLLPIWNGLQYFFQGQAYQNSALRNSAVVGQIIFGLAISCYGVWHNKNLSKQDE
ncbi:MAG: hypothetical protein LC768_01240 [Acidobacteria bacterium]|nr:hypothetical protein [Acidobacteriota bacterium]MCA1636956.1 hypothetical protein [Acidobacteriota bacterium]